MINTFNMLQQLHKIMKEWQEFREEYQKLTLL